MMDMKQVDLAKQTGIATATINRYVKGKVPTLENALKISEALEVHVDEIWGLR